MSLVQACQGENGCLITFQWSSEDGISGLLLQADGLITWLCRHQDLESGEEFNQHARRTAEADGHAGTAWDISGCPHSLITHSEHPSLTKYTSSRNPKTKLSPAGMASPPVDRSSFGYSADPQLSSSFFTLLPAEVRNLIYLEFLKLCSTRQHIVRFQNPEGPDAGGPAEVWLHVPCCADPRAPDVRFDEFAISKPGSPERDLWGKRLKSDWCWHWPCRERSQDILDRARATVQPKPTGGVEGNGDDHATPAPPLAQEEGVCQPRMETGFLGVLTTCKRM